MTKTPMLHRHIAAAALACGAAAQAAPVYSNDFESATTAYEGLVAGGTLAPLTRATLPTDSGGLASANTSNWLGRLGAGVSKSATTPERVTLDISGLTPGARYALSFDLFIGGSWDGNASGYGDDGVAVHMVSGAIDTTLLDATFANGAQGINFGAYSPQSYSDANPVSSAQNAFARFEGADAAYSKNAHGDYAEDYAIYRFGRGAGNPELLFTAGASSASFSFARPASTSTDSADEYWALDNLRVDAAAAAVPEPGTWALGLAGLAMVVARTRRRGSRSHGA